MIAAQVHDLDDLSEVLGFAPQHLYWLVGNSNNLYREFSIPKRQGGRRKISAPITELKGMQKTILSRVLQEHDVSPWSFAYVRGRSVVGAARKLSGHKNVLRLDIKDFFPSITRARVFGLYQSLGFNSKVAHLLTSLTVFQNELCQGAPTSPYLANLISRKMDRELAALAESWGASYLRYSDDLFFFKPNAFNWPKFSGYATKIVNENGFHIHSAKIRFYPRERSRLTLGLETSRSYPHLPRHQQRMIRALFFKASQNPKWAMENLEELRGMLGWRTMVYGKDEKYFEYKKTLEVAGQIKVHEAFLV